MRFLDPPGSYDIIFADPPYNYELLDELIPKVISSLRSPGVFILESSPREFSIPPTRVKDYGDSQLTFWENN